MFVATVLLAVLLGGGFLAAGGSKLAGVPRMEESRVHLGLSPKLFKAIGGLEVLGAAGLFLGLIGDLALIGVLAGLGLIAMTIGAAYYHQKSGDAMKDWMPAIVMGSLAILFIIFRIASA